jgi:hypothetical protein
MVPSCRVAATGPFTERAYEASGDA